MATFGKSSVRTSTASITTSRTTTTTRQSSRATSASYTPSAPGPMRNIRSKPPRRGYGLFYSDDEDDAPDGVAIPQTRPTPATTSKLPRAENVKQPQFTFRTDPKALFLPGVHRNHNKGEDTDEHQVANISSIVDEQSLGEHSQHPDLTPSERSRKTITQPSLNRAQASRVQPYPRGTHEISHGKKAGFGLSYDHDDDSIELEAKFNAQYAMATDESTSEVPKAEFGNSVAGREYVPHTPIGKGQLRVNHNQSTSSSPDYQYKSRSPDGHPTPGKKTSWGQWIKKLIPGSVHKAALSRPAELLEDMDRTINTTESFARVDHQSSDSNQPRREDQDEEQSFLVPGAFEGLFEDDALNSGNKDLEHNYANSLLLSEVYNSRLITPDTRPASSHRDPTMSRAKYAARPSRRVSTSFTGHDRSTPSGLRLRLPKVRGATTSKPSATEEAHNASVSKRVRRDYVVDAMTEAEKERIQIQKLAEVEQMRRDLAVKLNESAYEERKLRVSLGLELPDDDQTQHRSIGQTAQLEQPENDNLGTNRKRKVDQQVQADESIQIEVPSNATFQQQSTPDSSSKKSLNSTIFMDSPPESIPKLPATPTLSHAQLPAPMIPEEGSITPEAISNVPGKIRGAISPQKSLGYARSQAEKFKPIKSSGLRSSTTISNTLPANDTNTINSVVDVATLSENECSGTHKGFDGSYTKLDNKDSFDANGISLRKQIEMINQNQLELYHIPAVKFNGCKNILCDAVEESWDSGAQSVQSLLDLFKTTVIPATL